eukprot:2380170-Rhodomonas_salina.2
MHVKTAEPGNARSLAILAAQPHVDHQATYEHQQGVRTPAYALEIVVQEDARGRVGEHQQCSTRRQLVLNLLAHSAEPLLRNANDAGKRVRCTTCSCNARPEDSV